jgi:hypothetical protein
MIIINGTKKQNRHALTNNIRAFSIVFIYETFLSIRSRDSCPLKMFTFACSPTLLKIYLPSKFEQL